MTLATIIGVAVPTLGAVFAYCLGRITARADADLDRMFEQQHRDQLARDVAERIAAANSRPQLHAVGDVVPMRSRELLREAEHQRDTARAIYDASQAQHETVTQWIASVTKRYPDGGAA